MKLHEYISLEEKNLNFRKSSSNPSNTIDDFEKFNSWYQYWHGRSQSPDFKHKLIFRGMTEARHKLYNSSQRIWNTYSMSSWPSAPHYRGFIEKIIDQALNGEQVIKKALDAYGITQPAFPTLSILQHYGAPTPLLDWTYNLDVALFFATYNTGTADGSADTINDYFSIYVILKQSQEIEDLDSSKTLQDIFPPEDQPDKDRIYILSDFSWNDPNNQLKQQRYTTIYNQNIIPQEGLFLFNPYPDTPLEDCFNLYRDKANKTNTLSDVEIGLAPFLGMNINKNLSEFIRRKIANHGITADYIYPKLDSIARKVKEGAINAFV